MKKLFTLFGILVSTTIFAAEAPTTFQTNGLRLGRQASSLDKYLEFNVGDGALNPKMSVDTTSKRFTLSQDVTRFGDGTLVGNKVLEAYIGADPLPNMRYNVTTSKWQVSHDGVVYFDLGEAGANFSQQAGVPTTIAQNDSVVVTHPAVTSEQVAFSVLEGRQGLTNTQLTYNTGTSANFFQQDSVNGTQFNVGDVSLKAAGTGVDAFVTMLLHFTGANNTTTVIDEINMSRVFTAVGGAAIGTLAGSGYPEKFGSYSKYVSSANDYFSTPGGPDFAFGTGDFTIDLWVNNINQAQFQIDGLFRSWICYTNGGGGTTAWQIRQNPSNAAYEFTDANNTVITTTVDPLPGGSWHHIAVSRTSGQIRMFANGIQQGSAVANSQDFSNTSNTLTLGKRIGDTYSVPGIIDEVRISKGIGRYTSNFSVETQEYGSPDYPTAQSYYVRTDTGSQIDATAMSLITGCSQSSSTPVNTTLRGLVSFDGRSTWQRWNGSAWVFEINDASLGAYDFKTNGNTMAEICTGLTNFSTIGIPTIDVVAGLGTSDSMVTPTLSSFLLTYTGAFDNASLGKPGSTADYGVRRLTPTTTRFTKQSLGPSTVYLNVIN